MNADKMESGWMKALILGLVVAGSVIIFILGVMVGSNVQVPPESLQGAVSVKSLSGQPEEETEDEGMYRTEVVLPEKEVEVKSEEMTFYDTLEGPGRELTPAKITKTPQTELEDTTVAKVTESQTPALNQETKSPVKTQISEPEPAPVAQASAKKESRPFPSVSYAVQVLASGSRQGAQKEADKIRESGYNTYLITKETSRGTLHIVRIGKFSTREEAAKIKLELRQGTNYDDAFVVKE